MPTLFQNYQEYIEYFIRNNGIIEAGVHQKAEIGSTSPSLLIRIDPDGQINYLGSYDKIEGLDYVNFGSIFPQTSLKNLN